MSEPRYTFKVGDEVCWVDDRAPRSLEVHDGVVTAIGARGTVTSHLLGERAGVSRTFSHLPGWGPEHMCGRFTLVPRHVGDALRDGHIPRAVAM